jgi:hypothetical protein
MAGDITGRTNLSSLSLDGALSLSGNSISVTSLGQVNLGSGTSLQVGSGATVTFALGASQVVASGATVTWQPGFMWSVGTISTAGSLSSLAGTGMQIGFFFGASGCSLVGRSGNTIYTFGTSAVSAAAP